MVNTCANPGCGKPLLYLREGRIFLFEIVTGVMNSDSKPARHMEHFWLCGLCSQNLILRPSAEGIEVVRKLPAIRDAQDWEFGDEENVPAGVPF